MAANDSKEFLPINLAKIISAFFLIPFEVVIRNIQLEIIGLWHCLIDKFLPQGIVGRQLDAPSRRLVPNAQIAYLLAQTSSATATNQRFSASCAMSFLRLAPLAKHTA